MILDFCCSCCNFKHCFASAGICKLNNTSDDKIVNFVDYLDTKCKKWSVCDKEKDFFESLNR